MKFFDDTADISQIKKPKAQLTEDIRLIELKNWLN